MRSERLATYGLGAICSKIGSGATPRGGKDSYLESGIALIRSQNVRDLEFSESGLARISTESAEKLASASVLSGDVLLNITGDSVARCCLAPALIDDARVNQHVMIIRPDPRVLEAGYLAYWLVDRKASLLALASAGATRPALTKSMVAGLSIELPAIEDQRRAVRTLRTLEDKIQNNRKLAKTLEETAATLFQARFVDFVGHGDLIESEIGPIPRGWLSGHLSDLCSTQYGYTASASSEAEGPRFLRVMDINKVPWVAWGSVPRCEIDPDKFKKYSLSDGDILVARMADPGKSTLVESLTEPAVFASYLVRLSCATIDDSYFVARFLQSDGYLQYCRQVMGGSVQKNMNAKLIVGAPIVIPPSSVRREFTSQVRPLRKLQQHLVAESQTLTRIRDTLLPKLISGEIRVPEAEEIVEEIA